MAEFDPQEMSRRGRVGALIANSRHDGHAITAKARETFTASFTDQARSEAIARGEDISDVEAARRGEFLRRAFYTRIAFKSARVRSRSAGPEAA